MENTLNNFYKMFNKREKIIGGGEGVIGIYGTVNKTGTAKILEKMCLDTNTILYDVGSGISKPLLHALIQYNIKLALGVEIDHVKVLKSQCFIDLFIQHNVIRPKSCIIKHQDIEDTALLNLIKPYVL
jgi:hypothetical protein